METSRVSLFLLLLFAVAQGQNPSIQTQTTIIEEYEDSFIGSISLNIQEKNMFSWRMYVLFNEPVFNLQIWRAAVIRICQNNRVYEMANMRWNGHLEAGSTLDMTFQSQTATGAGVIGTVLFNDYDDYCSGPIPTPYPTDAPLYSTDAPDYSTDAPVNHTDAPTAASTAAPVDPTDAPPAASTAAPVDPTTAAVDPTAAPTEGQTVSVCATCMSEVVITNSWTGNFDATITVTLTNTVNGWDMDIYFSEPVDNINIPNALVSTWSSDKMTYSVYNQNYNGIQSQGSTLTLGFQASYSGSEPSTIRIDNMSDQPLCCMDVVVTSPIPTAAPGEGCHTCCSTTAVTSEWEGNFNGEFTVPITKRVTGGWTAEIYFSTAVNSLEVYNADVTGQLNGNTVYQIRNKQHNADYDVGAENYQGFHGTISGSTPTFYVYMVGQPQCCNSDCDQLDSTDAPVDPTDAPVDPTDAPVDPTEPTEPQVTAAPQTLETDAPEPTNPETTDGPVPTLPANSPYDYGDVLYKSILFYEAQRSGELPPDNRIPYRGDSALTDAGTNGEDLTGGWYDAGDYVKFGHPMAGAATVLAWGLIEYKTAYDTLGELENMYDCIKWATDYFLKCHTGEYEFYAQVGDGDIDHAYWGRPEQMNLYRPALKVTAQNPGSDVVGETAAALAAASIAFQDIDSTYSATLLDHAKELYEFAKTYQGKYSDSIEDAAAFYPSTSYQDEICWAAAWLYKATLDNQYLMDAENFYDQYGLSTKPWAFDWDDKKAGLQVLLYQLTDDSKYRNAVESFIGGWVSGADVSYTQEGLAWRIQWSPNRYSANVAFLALVAADLGIDSDDYRMFAKTQINYMLGDTGRSYVVGFGNNPPDRPHHGSSSCPDLPAACGWDEFNYDGPNPQILEGALVGGPDINDNFENDRKDYIQNEVTCDYNAGFQSSVAGIIQLLIDGTYFDE